MQIQKNRIPKEELLRGQAIQYIWRERKYWWEVMCRGDMKEEEPVNSIEARKDLEFSGTK